MAKHVPVTLPRSYKLDLALGAQATTMPLSAAREAPRKLSLDRLYDCLPSISTFLQFSSYVQKSKQSDMKNCQFIFNSLSKYKKFHRFILSEWMPMSLYLSLLDFKVHLVHIALVYCALYIVGRRPNVEHLLSEGEAVAEQAPLIFG